MFGQEMRNDKDKQMSEQTFEGNGIKTQNYSKIQVYSLKPSMLCHVLFHYEFHERVLTALHL